MRRLTRVSFVLLSMFGFALGSPSLSAQERGQTRGERAGGFQLEPNYPNPFNPETTIPFVLNEELFVDGQPVRVSMRIYNLLTQPIAVPLAKRHPAGEIELFPALEYTSPGRYEAFWDGRDGNGAQVASGIYWLQLTVNGVSKRIRMFVEK